MRVTESSEPAGAMAAETPEALNQASIVHVNLSNRLATIRNGLKFSTGDFLIVKDREGTQTGVLKARPDRPIGLQTADVLEGEPDINHIVVAASASETERLSKIYRDAEDE